MHSAKIPVPFATLIASKIQEHVYSLFLSLEPRFSVFTPRARDFAMPLASVALANIPLPIIQAWMGHADVATTAIYLAVCDDEEYALMAKAW